MACVLNYGFADCRRCVPFFGKVGLKFAISRRKMEHLAISNAIVWLAIDRGSEYL
jgi:hypothetical protein